MKTLGRYQLQEKLGQGGMGIVYRAFDTLLERVVAVKLISASIDENPELRDRFFREARAAGQLSHPNVITVYDLGEHEGQPYLAMEYLDGEDLQSRMARPELMSLRRRVDVACEICAGLEYAHARGIVHRDIKPANVFLPTGGGVKILDFGLARLMTSELTRSHVMMGTVNYMAPEQIRGERADHRADIFSTGVLFYELLSGRKAFDGDSFASLMFQILEHEPTALHEIDPTLPSDLVAVVERAMAKLREERYQQISDVAKDLALVRQQLTFPESPATGRVAPSAWRTGPVTSSASDETRILASPPPGAVPSPLPSAPAHAGTEAPTILATPRELISSPGARKSWARRLLPLAAVALLGAGAAATWWWYARVSTVTSAPAASTATPAPPSSEPGPAAAPPATPAPAPSVAPVPAPAEVPAPADGPPPADRERTLQAARAAASQARTSARAARAQTLAPRPYGQAAAVEEEAGRLRSAGREVEATAKYYEASGLFRGAQAAAETEAAARLAKAASPQNPPPPATSPRSSAPADDAATRAPVTAPPATPPSARAEAPPAAASPDGTAPPPVSPTPAAPAPAPTSPAATPPPREAPSRERVERPEPAPAPPASPAPSPTAAVDAVLQEYRSAMESRSLAALRRIWPTLGGAQLAAIRDEFDHATRISVELVDPRIGVSGQTATVTFVRRYALVTVDGQRLQSNSRTTMELRRAGDAWVIEAMRFQPVR